MARASADQCRTGRGREFGRKTAVVVARLPPPAPHQTGRAVFPHPACFGGRHALGVTAGTVSSPQWAATAYGRGPALGRTAPAPLGAQHRDLPRRPCGTTAVGPVASRRQQPAQARRGRPLAGVGDRRCQRDPRGPPTALAHGLRAASPSARPTVCAPARSDPRGSGMNGALLAFRLPPPAPVFRHNVRPHRACSENCVSP